MVDVVIPLYRPDAKTGILLRRLLKQDYEINRIILINTEKEYFNEELLFDPVIEVHHITKPEFDHGATRHMGMELSDADYVLFLTMDAIPADTHLMAGSLLQRKLRLKKNIQEIIITLHREELRRLMTLKSLGLRLTSVRMYVPCMTGRHILVTVVFLRKSSLMRIWYMPQKQ